MMNDYTIWKLAKEQQNDLLKEAELYRRFPDPQPARRALIAVLVAAILIALVAVPVMSLALWGG